MGVEARLMRGCDTERFLEGFTDPFEIRFQPLIEEIQKQKGDLDDSYAKMVLHESIEALRAQQDSKSYSYVQRKHCRALTDWM